MRHPIALAVVAVFAVAAPPALAQTKLTVAGYGGSFEEMMRKDLIPAFEKQHNARIEYVAGNSTNNLARLQAQKGNQEIDVAIVDDGPMYQAVALGFCTDLKGVPMADIHEPAKMGTTKAIGLGMVATGLVYNKKYFADNKLPAPTSWNDLADPKFRKKVVVPPLNNTYGLHTVVMYARMGGGGEKNIDPGFATMKDKVGPNVLVYEPNPGKMTELFQSGQAVIAVWGSGRVKALADTGFPAEFVYPKEGGVALGVAICPIAKPQASELAHTFINWMLTPEVQVQLAKGQGFGPVNKKTVLTKEQQVGLPYGDDVAKLVAVDWNVINEKRDEWNKRWTREIER